ncbi:MAG: Inner membrane symporter YihP [Firmicutes bacterium ADurb.Bin300]|nr:MAG: Inner membrane symporter YihP [Firmicutes bacterium ADurb.Bin300]
MYINKFLKLLGRFVPTQTLENIEEGLRNPIRWLRGGGIPPEHITPWELLLFSLSSVLGGMSDGYTGKRDFLYKEVYRIPPNYLSVAGIITSLWDAANDPFLGAWIDKKRFGMPQFRTIMRISAFTGHTLNIIKMIDGGLSAWQHVALLLFCNMAQDIIGTLDSVAWQKLGASVSPLTQQRTRISVWRNMGGQAAGPIASLPMFFMGFKDVFGFSDYQIIFVGSCLLLPFAVTASILPTFVRQRVDFSQTIEESQEDDVKPSIIDSFRIIKHNRYFIANSIAGLITVFSPDIGDELMVYRYLMPKFNVFGREMSGEGVLLIKQAISGIPATFMQAFNRQIINKMGGPLRAQKLNSIIIAVSKLIQYFVGYNSIPKLAVTILTETLINASRNWDGIAGTMLNYEFYDYVELKTGRRSEGVTAAINGLFSKIITNNIGLVTGNAFLQWTGYKGGYLADGTTPPERYMKYMWPMYTLIPMLDNTIWTIARCAVKWTPEDRDNTERELAERRAAILTEKEEQNKKSPLNRPSE